MPALRSWLAAILFVLGPSAGSQPTSLTVRALTPADGLSDVVVSAIAPARAGGVWIGGEGTVDRFDGVRFWPVPLAVDGRVQRLVETAIGLTITTTSGSQRWLPLPLVAGPLQDTSSREVVGTPAERLLDGAVTEQSQAYPDRVWVGTRGDGLFIRDTTDSTLRAVALVADGDTLPRVDVLALREEQGSLWIGTIDGLLHADVTPPRFRSVRYDPARPDGLPTPGVMTIHASRRVPGDVWVGSRRGGLVRLDWSSGQAERWFERHPALSVPFAIHEASDGALWLGGLAPTAFRFDPATNTILGVPLSAAANSYVTDIVPRRGAPGSLWVTTYGDGAFVLDTDSLWAEPLPVSADQVWTVHEAPADPGALYAATHGNGLVRIDLSTGDPARVEPSACDLDDRIVSLTSSDGVLWIGSWERRLFRLDLMTGACLVYGPSDGVPDARVGGVFVDDAGYVWLSTMEGLARLDPATDVFTQFSEEDGLPPGALFFQARDQTPGERIWVGGAGGLTAFDPLAVLVDTTAQPPTIARVSVDGTPVPIAETTGGLNLRHDQNDIAVEFAASDLRQPGKNRYRVRLAGIEDEWQRSSEPEVRYPQLAPGEYIFQVSATNRDGYWSPPTELAIEIRPPYWQTPWFWALLALSIGAVGFVAHRYRVEQLMRVERTRRRIADDLHDHIGSQIASVALRLDATGRAPALPDDLRNRLDRLSASARSVVDDLRDTVWLIDADRDDLRSVADRMEQFALDTLSDRGSVERGDVPAMALSMESRRDLYFLFTEALHNATRHADAERVVVRFGVEGGAFVLSVEDEGRGFDSQATSDGNGLRTMRQRAQALGADLQIDTVPEEGTTVRLRMPLG